MLDVLAVLVLVLFLVPVVAAISHKVRGGSVESMRRGPTVVLVAGDVLAAVLALAVLLD